MKEQITDKDQILYNNLIELHNTLKDEYGIKSSEIGSRLGKTTYDASAYLSPTLKKLIKNGAVEKVCRGHYKPITYSCINGIFFEIKIRLFPYNISSFPFSLIKTARLNKKSSHQSDSWLPSLTNKYSLKLLHFFIWNRYVPNIKN
ncbi:hypothetical protein [Bacillus sp. FJAT-42376]|uniref:hypothetical protein n=1 Tax=Bacillus sp. FJAT-42376 TaxID=2014076 RepID=UPI000F4E405D|nr:hypothetical protein [Bacillus sp. FJAT-42376]